MTKGIDGQTIDGISLSRINSLINKIKDHSYQPKPARRTYILKKNGKQRPLGIPSVDDKLVQEVVRMLLESIWDSIFMETSHGFRKNRSCHTALENIKNKYTGVKWFVEGDIKSFFDNIDHHVLVGLLRKRISDEYFIGLIWKFLKAGYMENWTFHGTYSGTPQGSILSPVLANIYLNELDNFMDEYKNNFNKGHKRKRNPEFRKLEGRKYWLKKKYARIWSSLSPDEKSKAKREIKAIEKAMMNTDYADPLDGQFKRVQYTRYADDFLVGVIGSKNDAEKLKSDIKEFLFRHLKLEMSDEKTLITNARKPARFLGYDIKIANNKTPVRNPQGNLVRVYDKRVKLYVPKEKWLKKLLDYKALKISYNSNHKEIWKSAHRKELINKTDIDILRQFNSEIRGLYNYYKMAHNVPVLHKFGYFMKYSMYKTYAAKYKTHISNIRHKFETNGIFCVKYSTKKGEKIHTLYNNGFRRVDYVKVENIDATPYVKPISIYSPAKRIRDGKCEICHTTDADIYIHHVRKLTTLTNNKMWENIMLSRNRKTLALCEKCHSNLHAGLLD